MLEVRGLGVMNIRQMFGDTAVKRNKYLRLIVHLIKAADTSAEAMHRLTGEVAAPSRVLDLDVPVFQLPVAAGRNLAVLTEAAVRLHMLRAKGLDPAAAFLARHAQLLSTSHQS
jgi:HPr kinase/phosphorylase